MSVRQSVSSEVIPPPRPLTPSKEISSVKRLHDQFRLHSIIASDSLTAYLNGYLSWVSSHDVRLKVFTKSYCFHQWRRTFHKLQCLVYVMAIIWDQKLGSHDESHSSWSSSIKVKKVSELPKVTVESRVWYQADVNFQDLSEVVWVAVSINQKTLNYDRRIKINQKRLMKCYKSGNQTIDVTEITN